MKKNNISFVVPAYNCEDTIEESIESIFDTNFSNGDEVLIVEDGSTDQTLDVIRSLEKKYSIRVIVNKKNKGCPQSRNIGIKNSKNELIFNLDADDVLEKESVIKLKKYFGDNDADLAMFSESRYFRDNLKKITHKSISPAGEYTLADFLSGLITPGGNYLYKKSVWKKIGGYDEYGKGLHEYWGFTLKILANGYKAYCMPRSYYFHRVSSESLFYRESKKNNEENAILKKMIKPYLELLEDEDSVYVRDNLKDSYWFHNLKIRGLNIRGQKSGRVGFVWHPMSSKFWRFVNICILKIKKALKIDRDLLKHR